MCVKIQKLMYFKGISRSYHGLATVEFSWACVQLNDGGLVDAVWAGGMDEAMCNGLFYESLATNILN